MKQLIAKFLLFAAAIAGLGLVIVKQESQSPRSSCHRISVEQAAGSQLYSAMYVANLERMDVNRLVFAQIPAKDYSKFETDSDIGWIINLARSERQTAITFLLPVKTDDAVPLAVLFRGTNPTKYLACSSADESASKTVPPASLAEPLHRSGAQNLRWSEGRVIASNGVAMRAYKVVY